MDYAVRWNARLGRREETLPATGLELGGHDVAMPEHVMADRVRMLDPLFEFAKRCLPNAEVVFVPSLWMPVTAALRAWPFLDLDSAEVREFAGHGAMLRSSAFHRRLRPEPGQPDGRLVMALSPLWHPVRKAFYHEAWHYACARLLRAEHHALMAAEHGRAMAADHAAGRHWAFYDQNPEEWACDLFGEWATLTMYRDGAGWGEADAMTRLFRDFASGRLARAA